MLVVGDLGWKELVGGCWWSRCAGPDVLLTGTARAPDGLRADRAETLGSGLGGGRAPPGFAEPCPVELGLPRMLCGGKYDEVDPDAMAGLVEFGLVTLDAPQLFWPLRVPAGVGL